MEILKAEKINKSFGEKQVLRDVSITLDEGEIVSLIGVSGAGKTTLFNVLSGIYPPDSGSVLLKDEDITGRPGEVSYMMQKDLLFPYRHVIDNVTLPLILKGVKKKEARETARPYFSVFGLEGTEMQYPRSLSGGMRQRAALLRTYLSSKGVALLDEPFSALDTITKAQIHRWYLDVMGEINLSTLFITHDIDEAVLLSDRIYILSGSPGTITHEIVIEEPKPRREDFSLSGEFLAYKRQIVEAMHLM
ncbi:MAG: ABC transporter ATP-binding protein [Clostridia bacterium]|nr:ABC transporter ATP-binding protein [Clostridia bacterium]